MRIFLTGATGYIGSAVLDGLLRAGHDVTALVRDNEKAARVAARSARPVIGNLADPDSYRASAEAQDGYVHTAFDSSSSRGPAIERAALEASAAQRAVGPREDGAATAELAKLGMSIRAIDARAFREPAASFPRRQSRFSARSL